jgi:methylthioribose-1-phosphate isomerase
VNEVKVPLPPLRPVLYDVPSNTVRVLDQRKLPACEEWLALQSADEVIAAIKNLTVRGAPAIGVVAAFALACEARRGTTPIALASIARKLALARPTAVNLAWAVERMSRCFESGADALLAEAQAIRDEDEAACRRIGELGAPLIPQGAKILTHCNAGALATAGYGTALGVVRAAFESGNPVSVLADETRPFLQGARLTAWELHRDGIPVTILTDNMAGWLMEIRQTKSALIPWLCSRPIIVFPSTSLPPGVRSIWPRRLESRSPSKKGLLTRCSSSLGRGSLRKAYWPVIRRST